MGIVWVFVRLLMKVVAFGPVVIPGVVSFVPPPARFLFELEFFGRACSFARGFGGDGFFV